MKHSAMKRPNAIPAYRKECLNQAVSGSGISISLRVRSWALGAWTNPKCQVCVPRMIWHWSSSSGEIETGVFDLPIFWVPVSLSCSPSSNIVSS